MRKEKVICIGVIFIILSSNVYILSAHNIKEYNETNNKQNLTNEIKQYFKEDIPIIHISASSDYEYGLNEGLTLYNYYNFFIRFTRKISEFSFLANFFILSSSFKTKSMIGVFTSIPILAVFVDSMFPYISVA